MTGAEVAQAKKDYEDRQMKKLADEKKREREADRVHKAKVKVSLLRKLFTLIFIFGSVGRSRAQGQGQDEFVEIVLSVVFFFLEV